MDRRQQARADNSAYSITDSTKNLASTKPEQILSRMLSTKSYIPTTSSLAENYNTAQDNVSLEIGKGQCGTVYALQGTLEVAKIPNSADKVTQLLTEYKMHYLILKAICEVETTIKKDIHIPELRSWINPNSKAFWNNNSLRYSQNVDAQNFALVSNRIFPIPLPIREALVDALLPPAISKRKQEFLAKPENKNCLIRIYLGRRETNKNRTNLQNIRLQNFPLHVNEMEHLQLDTSYFAQVMAQTLAILHWKAGVDGNDIEFILGSSPSETEVSQLPTPREIQEDNEWSLGERFAQHDFGRQSISIWLIDFNQCSTFEDNSTGLKRIVDAFFWNDPYYPQPNSTTDKDQKLWAVFSERYLNISRLFTTSATPGRFISTVEERSRKGVVSGLF
ncbi:hypothetical protein QQS21_001973 [Conoideocrella luteorostrata]|uniref:DUF3669 domain-containing protein n=1 Tax=Conoideocrella luteorostrata TaxID=1105319 RepID=A0AAJ0CZ48_9HYPO|nr:hypothetical protein QQS21_001973 [Conoideocrella luteorostrata]